MSKVIVVTDSNSGITPDEAKTVSYTHLDVYKRQKVNIMKEEGIHFVTGCDVGKDIKPAELYKKYDRVILCCRCV